VWAWPERRLHGSGGVLRIDSARGPCTGQAPGRHPCRQAGCRRRSLAAAQCPWWAPPPPSPPPCRVPVPLPLPAGRRRRRPRVGGRRARGPPVPPHLPASPRARAQLRGAALQGECLPAREGPGFGALQAGAGCTCLCPSRRPGTALAGVRRAAARPPPPYHAPHPADPPRPSPRLQVVPFPQMQLQSRWVARVLSGRVSLPSVRVSRGSRSKRPPVSIVPGSRATRGRAPAPADAAQPLATRPRGACGGPRLLSCLGTLHGDFSSSLERTPT
jgi:hypothetical protein